MEYSKFNAETLRKAVQYNDICKQSVILTNEKGAAMFNLAIGNYANPMPPELYKLRLRAIQENAYIHPGWDYLKYPSVDLDVDYSNINLNKIYEETLCEDGELVYIYIGRCDTL